jgi:hypothetical protein
MGTHDGFYFGMFFDAQFSDGYFFLSSIYFVFCTRDETSVYHTIYHTRYITFGRMVVTPELGHSRNTSSTSHELFEDAELMESDIAFCKKYFFHKHMYSMTRFHQGLKEEHDILFSEASIWHIRQE